MLQLQFRKLWVLTMFTFQSIDVDWLKWFLLILLEKYLAKASVNQWQNISVYTLAALLEPWVRGKQYQAHVLK